MHLPAPAGALGDQGSLSVRAAQPCTTPSGTLMLPARRPRHACSRAADHSGGRRRPEPRQQRPALLPRQYIRARKAPALKAMEQTPCARARPAPGCSMRPGPRAAADCSRAQGPAAHLASTQLCSPPAHAPLTSPSPSASPWRPRRAHSPAARAAARTRSSACADAQAVGLGFGLPCAAARSHQGRLR